MGIAATVALAFRYPGPDSLRELRAEIRGLPVGSVRAEMERFLRAVEGLGLGGWEELHTRTLDLSPLFVPYVGHVVWGENYRRGEFMADLKAAQREAGVDPAGELPDHLEPILRLLDMSADPPTDLVDVLPRAIEEMETELKKADGDNPYRHLLGAVAHVVAEVVRAAQPAATEGARA